MHDDPLDPLGHHGPAPRLLSEINVTPFIDVMLVLLIIFMVAAPLMMVGVPLKLPRSDAPPGTMPRDPVVISLDKDGHVFVDKTETAADQLPTLLSARLAADPQLVVYMRADREVDYGRIMDLLGRLGQAGVARISLVAEAQSVPATGERR